MRVIALAGQGFPQADATLGTAQLEAPGTFVMCGTTFQ